MLDYTFIKNFTYAAKSSDALVGGNEKGICIFLAFETTIAELIIIIIFRKSYSKEMFIFMIILAPFLLFSGLTMCLYTHHFKQFLGLYMIVLAYPLKYLDDKEFKYTLLVQKIIGIVSIAGLLIYAIIAPIVTYNMPGEAGHKNVEKLSEVKKYINEKGITNPNVLAIDTVSTAYLVLDINPAYNKFTYQSWWQYDGVCPTLYEEMTRYIDTDANYLIIKVDSAYMNYKDFKDILNNKFRLVNDLQF